MESRSRRRELIVSGHVNVDRYLEVASLPAADRTAPVLAERAELGGTATNLARAARRSGVRVGILSRIGDGFPPAFRSVLVREGIDLRGLEEVPGAPTPTCTIVRERNGRTRTLIQQGPMAARGPWRLPGPWWKEYRWLHLGTGEPRHALRLARAARLAHLHVAFDPAQEVLYRWDRATFAAVLPFADILFGNRAELARAAVWAGGGRLDRLLQHVPLIVRTEGEGGATGLFRGGSSHVPLQRRPRAIRTLVGAGDAFRGGFYGAWFAGEPLPRCLGAGNEAAVGRIEGGA